MMLLAGVPVSEACAREKVEAVPAAVSEGFDFVKEYSPSWYARIPHLMRSVLLSDVVGLSVFEPVGKCWMVNPWKAEEAFDEPEMAAAFLGGLLVHDLSVAANHRDRANVTTVNRCRFLAVQAALEYFNACRARLDGPDMDAIISVFSELEAGKGYDDR